MTPVLDRAAAPSARPWHKAIAIPSGIPGMLTRDEREYLAWVAASASGGCVVELGCFLGCSTAALLTGLSERDRRQGGFDHAARLITHDSFLMPYGGGRHWAPGVREGEWFGDLFEANVAPYAGIDKQPFDAASGLPRPQRLIVRHGWLPEDAGAAQSPKLYPEQRSIDVLFVDLAKLWGVHNTVLHVFTQFVPVGGLVLQQDFKSWLHWLFLHMWQLRDQFEPVHDVPGGTVGFVRRAQGSVQPWTNASFPAERFDEIWNAIEASWAGFGSGQTALHATLARGRHAITLGRFDHGVECFERATIARNTLSARPDFAPWRQPLDGIWSDAVAMMRRGLVKAGASGAVVERAGRLAA